MPRDAFDILGLPPRFDLDPRQIERAFLTRAAKVHPDLLPQHQAAQAAADLTDARRVLDNPEARANLLLTRLGGASKEEDKSLPAGFLADIMELREAVEEALAGGDAAERARQREDALARRAEFMRIVGDLLDTAAGKPQDPALLADIRRELNAWRYIERLIEQLDPAYDPARNDFGSGA